ncbi:MAG: hypothetical protein QNL04_09110 [SAR324 cluster bacterium]|nr:hypothetical protein [SAR324 cluster bacterium]
MNKLFSLIYTLVLLALLSVTNPAYAQDFDDLGDLGDSSSEDTSDSSTAEEPKKQAIQFGGYVKPLAYWQSVRYSDEAWSAMQTFEALGRTVPSEQESAGYSDLGIRYQFNLEAFLKDQARFFMAVNIEYNEVSDETKPPATMRPVEAYLEIYQGSSTWKIGSQLVTWGYMEGVEVPADRINAKDSSYNSTEYEDIKMASTAVQLKQSLGDFTGIDLIFIPLAKANIDPVANEFFYNVDDEKLDKTTGNSKVGARLYTTLGDLDLSLSYVEGLDTIADVTVSDGYDIGRTYHKEKSPGVDMQYNLGSFFWKLSYVSHITEDSDGTDQNIKNSWDHVATGIESSFGSSTINLYVGQMAVKDWEQNSATATIANQLMGQSSERTDFISGHITSSFLTGDALSTTLIFAQYKDADGEVIKLFAKPTLSYKITDGLQVMASPTYVNAADTYFSQMQTELKYSF